MMTVHEFKKGYDHWLNDLGDKSSLDNGLTYIMMITAPEDRASVDMTMALSMAAALHLSNIKLI